MVVFGGLRNADFLKFIQGYPRSWALFHRYTQVFHRAAVEKCIKKARISRAGMRGIQQVTKLFGTGAHGFASRCGESARWFPPVL